MPVPTKPFDLVRAIEREKAERTMFNLSSRNWRAFVQPAFIPRWSIVPFRKAATKSIPPAIHGIYTFVIDPGVCSHPKSSFIAYVGKADRMTIRARFQSYLRDKKKLKRPQITYLLNKYARHLEFCFFAVPQAHPIGIIEDALIAALDPPFNRDQPAEVSLIRRGLT